MRIHWQLTHVAIAFTRWSVFKCFTFETGKYAGHMSTLQINQPQFIWVKMQPVTFCGFVDRILYFTHVIQDNRLTQYTLYTAISRKVVGKSARDNPERYCGWF